MTRLNLALMVGALILSAALIGGASAASKGTVSYSHPADVGTSERDCLDAKGTACVTRDLTGPAFNDGSKAAQWQYGPCSKTGKGGDNVLNDSRFGNVSDIVGKKLCLITQKAGKWNVVFSYYPPSCDSEFVALDDSSECGAFNYTRTPFCNCKNPDTNFCRSKCAPGVWTFQMWMFTKCHGANPPICEPFDYWKDFAARHCVDYVRGMAPQNVVWLAETSGCNATAM